MLLKRPTLSQFGNGIQNLLENFDPFGRSPFQVRIQKGEIDTPLFGLLTG